MPPHCDTMDGPVVIAAKKALQNGNVNLILPWAPEEAEDDIREAFEHTIAVRGLSDEAQELADLWFFETVVRLHRAGEGAAYTGLKPAGLDVGPVIPRVEKAIELEDPSEVVRYIQEEVGTAVSVRFEEVMRTKEFDIDDVKAARDYVNAFLKLTLFSHHLHLHITK